MTISGLIPEIIPIHIYVFMHKLWRFWHFFHFQAPICNLNLCLQPDITPETTELPEGRVADFQTNIRTIREAGYGKFDTIHKADLKISDIGNLLGSDWVKLAHELEIPDSDINIIKTEYPENEGMYRFQV